AGLEEEAGDGVVARDPPGHLADLVGQEGGGGGLAGPGGVLDEGGVGFDEGQDADPDDDQGHAGFQQGEGACGSGSPAGGEGAGAPYEFVTVCQHSDLLPARARGVRQSLLPLRGGVFASESTYLTIWLILKMGSMTAIAMK